MEPALFNSLIDISESPAARRGQADLMLERARWAATVFDRYDRDTTMRIVDAVAEAAHAHAAEFAEKVVAESGFGVAEHKKIKNELTAKPLVEFYRDQDYVNPRVDEARKIIEIPRPAGVVFALTPSTNPIATINYKVLLCLMTRNAIVMSPHPAVRETSIEAVTMLARAAEEAGAPAGIIQVLEKPSIPLVDTFMESEKTNVILATGGTPMVRAAYSSGNPAVGVGPGNAPVFVDASADIAKAAQRVVASKSFDNSVLCTNESVLITLSEVENQLKMALKSAGAYICSEEDTEVLRRFLFHPRGFNIEAIGRDAAWIAQECGIRVPANTKILVAPITLIGVEEPLSREKLCPVLSMHVAKTRAQALSQARAVLRLAGAGHSAAIHTRDEASVMEYASMVEVYRVVVNAPCSQGAAGFATNLAPTFTIGTGFFGRSSIGENVGPQHLVHWTRVAYNSEADEPFGNYHGIGRGFRGALPSAPADGVPGVTRSAPSTPQPSAASSMDNITKDELRRLIAAELRDLLRK
ncbi:aldehyde dehydrogenase family protein [uncultured Roseovarius sp.]|uniref:aldehyde dehydrogenase family protein n=1 Tax=uncultured Roseovarius sp. TaxID=293344 RepID=UPI00262C2D40|nr:aldehyde dehydrogenase family protein [uncultured Roseovarius sp.]